MDVMRPDTRQPPCHDDRVTSPSDFTGKARRPVLAINDRGLTLGLDNHGSWIIWDQDNTVWPAHDHLLGLLPLLERPLDAINNALSADNAEEQLLPALLRFALSSWSDYWAGLALGWLEAGFPGTDLVEALQELKDSPQQPQPIRHRALRLWRQVKAG
jgi:hypothetical protein